MHRGLAADDVDRLYAKWSQSGEHGPAILKRHVRARRQGPVKAESAGPVAPKRGVELYVVGACSHRMQCPLSP
jgi:hypothetical protein